MCRKGRLCYTYIYDIRVRCGCVWLYCQVLVTFSLEPTSDRVDQIAKGLRIIYFRWTNEMRDREINLWNIFGTTKPEEDVSSFIYLYQPCGMRPGHIHKHSTHTMSRIINWPIKFSELLANNSIKFILDYAMHTSGWLHKTNSAYLANWCGEAVNATLELHLLSQCGYHLIITRASTTCSQDA